MFLFAGWFYYVKKDFHYYAFELFKHLKPKGRFDLKVITSPCSAANEHSSMHVFIWKHLK
jgi:hypothetical protein